MPFGGLTVFEYLRINFSTQLQFSFFYFFLLVQLQFQIFPNYLFMQLQFFFAGINSAQVFCGSVAGALSCTGVMIG